jgi:hypothetical protein
MAASWLKLLAEGGEAMVEGQPLLVVFTGDAIVPQQIDQITKQSEGFDHIDTLMHTLRQRITLLGEVARLPAFSLRIQRQGETP